MELRRAGHGATAAGRQLVLPRCCHGLRQISAVHAAAPGEWILLMATVWQRDAGRPAGRAVGCRRGCGCWPWRGLDGLTVGRLTRIAMAADTTNGVRLTSSMLPRSDWTTNTPRHPRRTPILASVTGRMRDSRGVVLCAIEASLTGRQTISSRASNSREATTNRKRPRPRTPTGVQRRRCEQRRARPSR
jgi:hypothetical protein